MPGGGIPPEIADAILNLVKDDTKTLLSCCRASKGLCATTQPVLYRRVDILYHSSRLARLCTSLRIRWRPRVATDLVRLRTEPTVEAIREFFECVPNVLRFELAWSNHRSLAGTQLERSVVEVLQTWNVWPDLPQYPLPAGLSPPFRLKRLEVGHQVQNEIFRIGTSTSHETLERVTVPFGIDLQTGLESYGRLRHLCLEFSSYEWNSLSWCHERLGQIKAFLKAASRIVTLTFAHSTDSPRSNWIRTVRSTLPPNLETLVLHPWPMLASDAIRCLDIGLGQHLWPTTLRKIVWTSGSVAALWTDEKLALVRDRCLEHGISQVEFQAWRT
ncbi:hypothetical protein JCM3774_006458 [Rhodotorula dairenensis]